MLAQISSAALNGLEVNQIRIEIDASFGLPSWDIVGLPDVAVKESKERVRTAVKNSLFEFPARKIVVNLAPADIKKEGPSFDLPMAVAILAATEQLDLAKLSSYVFIGELGLDGSLRPSKGLLPIALYFKDKGKSLIVPKANASEAAMANVTTYGFNSLKDVVSFLRGELEVEPTIPPKFSDLISKSVPRCTDFAEIKGQWGAKRAMEIAAAGGHNIILIGSPGSGKTMIARAMPGIMPPLTFPEALEITKIYSVSGLLPEDSPLILERPFRAPHHSSSQASLIGGGRIPMPGEISLSHRGILFMDEFPEYRKDVLEALRQPLEDGFVTVSRVSAQLTYPSDFLLVASMNPCPCGHLNDPKKECSCSPYQISRYQRKVSGPLLDRFDLQIEVSPVEFEDLYGDSKIQEESSQTILKRVIAARQIQLERFKDRSIFSNSQMESKDLKTFCPLNERCKMLLAKAFEKLGLSARANNRILKISRTIADLDNSEDIQDYHISEAIQYRSLDKKIWQV